MQYLCPDCGMKTFHTKTLLNAMPSSVKLSKIMFPQKKTSGTKLCELLFDTNVMLFYPMMCNFVL